MGRSLVIITLGLGAAAAGCATALDRVVADEPLRPFAVADGASNEAADVSAFYGALADEGTWMDAEPYGDVWCPGPSLVGDNFTPYTRGHFAYGTAGWTWVGDLDVSWAVEHYGRWAELEQPDCDWAWVPDGDWSPAWVDFEVGGGMVAWSPKAPGAGRRKVRVAAPARARIAMPHVGAARGAPGLAGGAPSTVGIAATPGAVAKASGAASSQKSSNTSIERKGVVVVRESDFLAPEIGPVLLVGGARSSAVEQLHPVATFDGTGGGSVSSADSASPISSGRSGAASTWAHPASATGGASRGSFARAAWSSASHGSSSSSGAFGGAASSVRSSSTSGGHSATHSSSSSSHSSRHR